MSTPAGGMWVPGYDPVCVAVAPSRRVRPQVPVLAASVLPTVSVGSDPAPASSLHAPLASPPVTVSWDGAVKVICTVAAPTDRSGSCSALRYAQACCCHSTGVADSGGRTVSFGPAIAMASSALTPSASGLLAGLPPGGLICPGASIAKSTLGGRPMLQETGPGGESSSATVVSRAQVPKGVAAPPLPPLCPLVSESLALPAHLPGTLRVWVRAVDGCTTLSEQVLGPHVVSLPSLLTRSARRLCQVLTAAIDLAGLRRTVTDADVLVVMAGDAGLLVCASIGLTVAAMIVGLPIRGLAVCTGRRSRPEVQPGKAELPHQCSGSVEYSSWLATSRPLDGSAHASASADPPRPSVSLQLIHATLGSPEPTTTSSHMIQGIKPSQVPQLLAKARDRARQFAQVAIRTVEARCRTELEQVTLGAIRGFEATQRLPPWLLAWAALWPDWAQAVFTALGMPQDARTGLLHYAQSQRWGQPPPASSEDPGWPTPEPAVAPEQ